MKKTPFLMMVSCGTLICHTNIVQNNINKRKKKYTIQKSLNIQILKKYIWEYFLALLIDGPILYCENAFTLYVSTRLLYCLLSIKKILNFKYKITRFPEIHITSITYLIGCSLNSIGQQFFYLNPSTWLVS